MQQLSHYIHGQRVNGQSGRFGPVYNASTGEQIAEVPLATADEVRDAIASAAKAFPGWAAESPMNRARVMFRYKELLEKNMDELSELLATEHGKVKSDARGSVIRGLEVVEFACGIPHLLKGEFSSRSATVSTVYLHAPATRRGRRRSLPFNFPAMVPMWMYADGDRLRQHLHPQAVREGPVVRPAAGRALPAGGPAPE